MLTGKLASARRSSALSTHGISGSAAPAQLETALQLLYQDFTAPGDDPDAFALLKRQLDAAVANRGRSAGAGVRRESCRRSTRRTTTPSQPLTAGADRDARPRRRWSRSTSQRFANAADFTFFMVGAFKVDDVVPLLAQYVGSLPSTGQRTSKFKDVGLHFPETTQRAKVEQGREPRGQTVISFFADPALDPVEQEKIIAATDVLDMALRDILREDLGQTYTVSVGLSQPLPQRGERPHPGPLRRRAGEHRVDDRARDDRRSSGCSRKGRASDLTNRAKEAARRELRDWR